MVDNYGGFTLVPEMAISKSDQDAVLILLTKTHSRS
jgi:hypothetical protein